ncbi:putative XPC-binding domain-containing protein [Dioscorea sansibarensis]
MYDCHLVAFYLHFSVYLRALRALVQANPHILERTLEELGRQNSDVRQWTQDHQAEFIQDMAQPPQRPLGSVAFPVVHNLSVYVVRNGMVLIIVLFNQQFIKPVT